MKRIIGILVITTSLYSSTTPIQDCDVMKNNIINISQLIVESEDTSDKEFLNILKAFKKELVYTKQHCNINSKESKYYDAQLSDLKDI